MNQRPMTVIEELVSMIVTLQFQVVDLKRTIDAQQQTINELRGAQITP